MNLPPPGDLDETLGVATLPLFPLRLVLFPGQVLPLHIFEPRYRTMINLCIERELPFGVVLMRDDPVDWRRYQNDIDLPHAVGVTAHIRGIERLADGRMNIVTLGLHRFRVRQWRFDQPFLQGDVEALPMPGAVARDEVTLLQQQLASYVQLLSQIVEADIDLNDMPNDALALAYLVGSVLQLPWEDKQRLLELADLPTLYAAEHELLHKERMLLGYMAASEPRIEQQISGPTGSIFPN